MAELRLTVNGAPRTLEVDDDTPLLWILRDQLGLTGTKFRVSAHGWKKKFRNAGIARLG